MTIYYPTRLLASCLLLVIAATSTNAATCAQLQSELNFTQCSDLTQGFALAWKADAASIWLAIDADNSDAAGYTGIGISEAGGMKAADMIVVAHQAGQAGLQVYDLWSEANAQPAMDDHQDVVLVAPLAAGQQPDLASPGLILAPAAGRIRAVVRRPLHSCDTQDISITPGLPQHVVFSWGSNWPSYHGPGKRGQTVINFLPLPGDAVQPTSPDHVEAGALQLDLLMPNITIPAAPTAYLCTHFHLPDDRKYHIIAREALVKSSLVHHMILFGCNSPRPAVGDVIDCLSMERDCSTFVIGWAPGQDYQDFGPEAGFAFGKGPADEETPSWFALQTHYNNPTGAPVAAPDSSGMRITYTPNLRPHDLGVLVLTQMDLVIPPGQKRYVAEPSVCPSECTSLRLAQPVEMLTSLLHMHQAGATITTRHIRGNQELEPLGHRRVWNFNYQGAEPTPFNTRQLRPGDALITQCTYDTTSRTNTTRFGEGTMDEMCFNFVTYYPRVKGIEICTSQGSRPEAAGGTNTGAYTAVCGDSTKVSRASKPTGSQTAESGQQTNARLAAAGVLVNATWPQGYTPWTDPLCPSDHGAVPLIVAASGGAP